MDAIDFHPASQGASDGSRDSVSQLVHTGPKQEQNQQECHDGSYSALGSQKLHLMILKVRDQRVSSKK
jgi:hypothetical protein